MQNNKLNFNNKDNLELNQENTLINADDSYLGSSYLLFDMDQNQLTIKYEVAFNLENFSKILEINLYIDDETTLAIDPTNYQKKLSIPDQGEYIYLVTIEDMVIDQTYSSWYFELNYQNKNDSTIISKKTELDDFVFSSSTSSGVYPSFTNTKITDLDNNSVEIKYNLDLGYDINTKTPYQRNSSIKLYDGNNKLQVESNKLSDTFKVNGLEEDRRYSGWYLSVDTSFGTYTPTFYNLPKFKTTYIREVSFEDTPTVGNITETDATINYTLNLGNDQNNQFYQVEKVEVYNENDQLIGVDQEPHNCFNALELWGLESDYEYNNLYLVAFTNSPEKTIRSLEFSFKTEANIRIAPTYDIENNYIGDYKLEIIITIDDLGKNHYGNSWGVINYRGLEFSDQDQKEINYKFLKITPDEIIIQLNDLRPGINYQSITYNLLFFDDSSGEINGKISTNFKTEGLNKENKILIYSSVGLIIVISLLGIGILIGRKFK